MIGLGPAETRAQAGLRVAGVPRFVAGVPLFPGSTGPGNLLLTGRLGRGSGEPVAEPPRIFRGLISVLAVLALGVAWRWR